jgi:hypothetical protein
VWEFVRKGLQSVLDRTQDPWTPTDVYRCLRGNRASLFLSDDGFLILSRREEEWSLEPYLLVWVGWFKKGTALPMDAELFAWLDSQARSIGCKRLRIISPRLGWGKRLRGYFTLKYQTWEREIT